MEEIRNVILISKSDDCVTIFPRGNPESLRNEREGEAWDKRFEVSANALDGHTSPTMRGQFNIRFF